MHRRFPYALLCLAWLVIILSGCTGQSAYIPVLLEAESLMDSRPDTALTILRSLPPEALVSDGDRALHGLLLTEALDKNQLHIPDDSLALSAARHFAKVNDPTRRMIATYYAGRARYLNGMQDSALSSFFNAMHIAESIDAHFWAGMACRGISDIHHDSYNKVEELRYALLEYEHIKKSRRQPYINYAILDLARANNCIGNYETSLSLDDQATDSAIVHQDARLYRGAANFKMVTNNTLGRYEKADSIYQHLVRLGLANSDDSVRHCLTLCGTGRYKEALDLCGKISNPERQYLDYIHYLAYRGLNNTEKALHHLELLNEYENVVFRTSTREDVSAYILKNQENENELIELELQNASQKIWIITLSSISFIFLTFGIVWFFRNRYLKKINDKVLLADNLQDLLKAENERNLSIVAELLPSKYELLMNLCEIVIQNADPQKAKKKIAESVKSTIENLSIQKEQLSEMEETVNHYYDNIYTHFKADFEGLKEIDYRLFLFNILDFPNPVIALLLNIDSINSIYDRKRRLKVRIRNSSSKYAQSYLKVLSS